MNVQVRGRNIDLTDAFKEYVEKRLSKLDRYIENLGDAQVALTFEKGFYRTEVTIPFNGRILRGEESTEDMYSGIDLIAEKLEKQIESYKSKLHARTTRVGELVSELEIIPVTPEAEGPRVVKSKRFAMKPMPVEEAILQMNLLGHNFFVFTNAETDLVSVVYKRKDGNYGLIEPEF